MGNEEETASDLEPRPETDAEKFCPTGRVPSISDGLHRNELGRSDKGAQLPEPHVMHRDPAGKRERRC